MKISAACILALVAPAAAFAPNTPAVHRQQDTSLEVIRSKNFKNAKLDPNPAVDGAGIAKAGVSSGYLNLDPSMLLRKNRTTTIIITTKNE